MNKEINVNIKVNNLPETYKNYNYIICNLVEGNLWYYGADNDIKKLEKIKEENKEYLNQIIFELTAFEV